MNLYSFFYFLYETLFSLFYSFFFVRILIAISSISPFNQLIIIIRKYTKFIHQPLNRIVPTRWSIDFASIICLWIIGVVKLSLFKLVVKGSLSLMILPVAAIFDPLKEFLSFMNIAAFLSLMLSWAPVIRRNTMGQLLYAMTEPLFAFLRRFIHPFWGIDLTPWLFMLANKFVQLSIVEPFYWRLFTLL